MVNKPRIYQLLRQAGVIYTRADAMNLLKQNHVQVDGKIVRNPEYQVNPKKEQILNYSRDENQKRQKKEKMKIEIRKLL